MDKNDLISRAAALEALGECPYNWNDWPEEIQEVRDWESHKEAIENIPAVDAVPVVRCKDCVCFVSYSTEKDNRLGKCTDVYLPMNGETVDGWWFCADGERRDDDAAD